MLTNRIDRNYRRALCTATSIPRPRSLDVQLVGLSLGRNKQSKDGQKAISKRSLLRWGGAASPSQRTTGFPNPYPHATISPFEDALAPYDSVPGQMNNKAERNESASSLRPLILHYVFRQELSRKHSRRGGGSVTTGSYFQLSGRRGSGVCLGLRSRDDVRPSGPPRE